MVYTLVLEASAERIESSSLSLRTIRSSIARRSTYRTNLVQSGKPMILVTGLYNRSTIGSKRIVNCATPNGKIVVDNCVESCYNIHILRN